MRKTRKLYRDVVVAALASMLANAWIAWVLLSPPHYPVATDDVVLIVDFEPVTKHVDVPRDAEPSADARAHAPRVQHGPAPVRLSNRPEGTVSAPPSNPAEEAQESKPASGQTTAVFLQQAREWGERNREDLKSDPFSKRTPALPGRSAQMFRLREPPSPARLVARIGVLFGADGVTGCTKIDDRVAGYANSGDRAALEMALEYERRLCRP